MKIIVPEFSNFFVYPIDHFNINKKKYHGVNKPVAHKLNF